MRTVKRTPCGRCPQTVRCARIPLPAGSRAARTPPLARTARSAAVEQLLRIEEGGAFAGLVGGSPSVAGAPSRHDKKPLVRELDSRDARFVTELVAGVTRWRRRLDWLIHQLVPNGPIDVRLRQVLRLGIFELLELGKPDHVVKDHVDLAKRYVQPHIVRVANGVLRNVVRMRASNSVPSPSEEEGSAADALAIAASHPTWMVERWLERYGNESTMQLLAANNRQPSYSLRVNTWRISAEDLMDRLLQSGVEAEASPYLPHEFVQVVSGLREVMAQGLLANGLCQVQDESAGLVVALLDPQPGEDVLDACAAPGGKALFAAARMGGRGRLLAVDAHEGRLRGLAATGQQQGVPAGFMRVQAADLRALSNIQASTSGRSQQPHIAFDRVLLDVPCSGLGVLAKRADLRWRRSPAHVASINMLQDELLHAASILVKPGGFLVYSTCSIEPQENEERVQQFLQRHQNFVAEPCPAGLLPQAVLSKEGFLATLPHVHATDGAFGARLRRVN